MGELWTEFFLILFLVVLNAFFAGSEIALVTLRSTRVKQLIGEGSKAAKAIDRLLQDPSRLLATIQIGVTLAGFLASAAAAVSISGVLAESLKNVPVLSKYAQGLSVLIVTIIVSYVTLVLGELAPKRMALQKAETISLWVARPIEVLARIAGPFIALLTVSTNIVVKLLGGETRYSEPKLSEEEIRLMLAEQGTLNEEEKDMIEGVFEFGDGIAREVMVPRTEMISMERSSRVDQALDKLIVHGFSRYPVYDKNVDNVVGIVTIKDLIFASAHQNGDKSIDTIMREVYFIPESKNLLVLLKEMQKRQIHMTIVLDEYGGTAGIVTLEDLIEEIIGEINDEYNKEDVPIQLLSDRHGIFDGRVCVEDVSESLDIDLPLDETYETIAGMVFHFLGKKPKVGDRIEIEEVDIKVIEMERNRIKKVEVINKKQVYVDKDGGEEALV